MVSDSHVNTSGNAGCDELAPYAYVSRQRWDDPAFRALSDAAFRLLHCIETGRFWLRIPGLVRTSPGALADELRWTVAQVDAAFAELQAAGFVVADWDARLVWIVDAHAVGPRANPKMVEGWRSTWRGIPASPVREGFRVRYRGTLVGRGDTMLAAFDSACPPPAPVAAVALPTAAAAAPPQAENTGDSSQTNGTGYPTGNGIGDPTRNQYSEDTTHIGMIPPNPPGGAGDGPGADDRPSGVLPVTQAPPPPTPPQGTDPGLAAHEAPFLVAAYTQAVVAVLGRPWQFSRRERTALTDAVAAHCRGEDRKTPDAWVARTVRAFVTAERDRVQHLPGQDFQPRAWAAWLNATGGKGHAPRPGPARAQPVIQPQAPTGPDGGGAALHVREMALQWGCSEDEARARIAAKTAENAAAQAAAEAAGVAWIPPWALKLAKGAA